MSAPSTVRGPIAWVLLMLALLLVAAPWLLGEDGLHAVAGWLWTPHAAGSCPLCGATRAYVALVRGDLAGAHAANVLALPVWLALPLASLVAAVRLSTRRLPETRRP